METRRLHGSAGVQFEAPWKQRQRYSRSSSVSFKHRLRQLQQDILELQASRASSCAACHRSKLPALCSLQNGRIASGAESTENQLLELELRAKGEELRTDLKGTAIFLIGMMGSGKTTVGKLVSDALGYYFFDSDKLVEQASGGVSVAKIFEESNEEFFRDNESEVLSQLSSMARIVVATGGGAVVRSENWSYLRHGITVWLDVPLEALARRVVAAGTHKRPLLREASYSEALARLEELFEQRGASYANADVKVSVQDAATKMGIEDLKELTPSMIALEVLKGVQDLVRSQKRNQISSGGKRRIGL